MSNHNLPVSYKISKEIQQVFQRDMPKFTSFGFNKLHHLTNEPVYYIHQEQIDAIRAANINLDAIAQANYGMSFDEFIAPKKTHPYKIYNFLAESPNFEGIGDNPWKFPCDIDFTTMLTITPAKKSLPKIQGKPTSAEYYESYDPLTGIYSNILARIDFELTYDALGFITNRSLKLRFYRTNETVSEEFKELGRSYDPIYDSEYRIKEGVLRRQSIVDNLQLPILGVLQAVYPGTPMTEVVEMGRAFLEFHNDAFELFIKASKKDIITSITEATDPWLDAPFPPAGPGATVRMYIISELSISY